MDSKYQIYIFSILLIVLSLSLVAYKVKVLNFPLSESERSQRWDIEAKVTFNAESEGNSTIMSLAVPTAQKDFSIVSEISSSPGYGFTTTVVDGTKRAEWTKRDVKGEQTLYYSIDVVPDPNAIPDSRSFDKPVKQQPVKTRITAKLYTIDVVKAFMKNLRAKSADSLSYASLLINEYNKEQPDQAINLIKKELGKTGFTTRDLFLRILLSEGFHARKVGGITLDDGAKGRKLKAYMEVYGREKWQLYDLKAGRIDKSPNLFIWYRGGNSLLDAIGATKSKVRYAITKSIISSRQAALDTNNKKKAAMMDFSLFILPNESQNAFRKMLVVPLGTLVVVFMRVFIGLKTSGTFMPILLAMAFMQTQLLPGILMFLLVVAVGLVVRSYLSHLNLLLIARISAVVVIVVGIMALVAILSFKLNIASSAGITFFPMIILAWTIERMSILWEEEGPKDVVKQGGGSLIVAVMAFFVMTNKTLGFISFNFPEVLLAVFGIIVIMGRYSGYRLSELYRFASLAKESEK